jgi:uncharacterized protein (TIGR02611 family)
LTGLNRVLAAEELCEDCAVQRVRSVVRFIGRNSWRVTVSVAGFALLIVGAIMMVTPGPGLLVIITGLAILATQYAWAERALDAAKTRAAKAKDATLRKNRRPPGDPPAAGGSSEPPPLPGSEEPDAERERS